MRTIHASSILLAPILVIAGCGILTDPPPDPPGTPSGLIAEARSMGSVLLTWAAPATGGEVANYELDRAPAVGDFQQVAAPGGSALTFTDEGLEADRRYRYRLRACNEGGCSEYTASAAANTFGTIDITTTSLPDGAVGQAYTASLQAINAGDSYEWSVVAGALPAGLVLDDTAGIISGTPDTEETAQFTVQARSIDGQTAEVQLTLDILAALPITIENLALPPVIVGGTYDVPLRASGGGASITWSVVSGALPSGLAVNNDTNRLEGTPTATDTAAITLRAESFGEMDEAGFTLVVVQDDPGVFNITPMPVATVPATIKPHVDSAIARWERAITGNLQPVLIGSSFFTSEYCGGFGPEVNGTTLDDVIMMIDISRIDGPGNTLGQAAPCALRGSGTNPNVPLVGFLTLDSDDLLPITGTQTLTDLIFHEMGHILGFGYLWSADFLDLVVGSGTNQPAYTGAAAKEEYAALGQSGDIPIENVGGAGSIESHWRESIFNTEIMTSVSEQPGTPMPLSRMTIASMEDLGYTTNRDEADPYSLSAAARLGLPLEKLGYDVVYSGPVILASPDGTVLRRVLPNPEP